MGIAQSRRRLLEDYNEVWGLCGYCEGYEVLRVNIQILNVFIIDFALSMIYGLSVRHTRTNYTASVH